MTALWGTIPELFEAQASQVAARTAVSEGKRKTSFEELRRQVDTIAGFLLQQNLPKGTPIGIIVPLSSRSIAATLGILKAGLCCAPIDPKLPLERIQFIFHDLGIEAALTTNALRPSVEEVIPPTVAIHRVEEMGAGLPMNPSRMAPPLSGNDLAMIIYTSGSTGRPKGAMIEHGMLLADGLRLERDLGLTRDDRVLLIGSPAAVSVYRSMVAALLTGASVHPFDLASRDLQEFAPWMRKERVTFVQTIVSLFQSLLAVACDHAPFSTLRRVHLGGEPIYGSDLRNMRKALHPNCVVSAGYGLTETGSVCYYVADENDVRSSDRLPMGRPFSWISVNLRQTDVTGAEQDELGEVLVTGRYLARGYWGQDELTSQNFADVTSEAAIRSYRTGDLARLRKDGNYEFVGRVDDLVNLRGYQVNLAEIERAILNLGGVKQAVVRTYGYTDSALEVRADGFATESENLHSKDRQVSSDLIAYVSREDGKPLTTSFLRRNLAMRLPSHMVPNRYVILKNLPVRQSGKVERSDLPPPGPGRPQLDSGYRGPETPIERQLVDIWTEVLGIQPIGIDDHFLDIGGHSLHAVRIMARANCIFAVNLPIGKLLTAPTVAELSTLVVEARLAHADQLEPVWLRLREIESQAHRET